MTTGQRLLLRTSVDMRRTVVATVVSGGSSFGWVPWTYATIVSDNGPVCNNSNRCNY